MNVILFGATGMVGQSVLRECLLDNTVDQVLAIGRKPTGIIHAKLRETILNDMFHFDLSEVDVSEFHACFFCLGVSAAGMNKDDYKHLTFDLTLGWAETLARFNPSLTFIYVSGAGTGGKPLWAQVKGQTEDALLKLFPNAYMFRLAAMQPLNGEISKTTWTRISYKLLSPLLPLVRAAIPGSVITSEELGRAMIRVAQTGAPKRVLSNRDMIDLGALEKSNSKEVEPKQ